MRLDKEGARVVVTERDKGRLNDTVTAIEADDGKARAVAIDLRNPEAAREIVDAAIERGRLDIVVNCA